MDKQSIGRVLWNFLTLPNRREGMAPSLRVPIYRAFFLYTPYIPLLCRGLTRCSERPGVSVYVAHRLHSHPASFRKVEVAGTRFRLAAGRRKVWAVGFCFLPTSMRCAVLRSCIFLWSLSVGLYRTVQVQSDLIGWSYASSEMAAAFCLTVTAYRRVDTRRLPIFGSVQAQLQPFPESVWPC